MEVYCNACGEKKPMRRIRKPKFGRLFALLIVLGAILTVFETGSWTLFAILLAVGLILACVGKNYWECKTCGALTERI